jgi:hypothetical protein
VNWGEWSIEMRIVMRKKDKMLHSTSALASGAVLALTLAMAAPAHALTTTSIDTNYTPDNIQH